MDQIFIGTPDGLALLPLHGAGIQPPVRGALLRESSPADGDTVEQTVDLLLDGAPDLIDAFLENLRRELALAEAAAGSNPAGFAPRVAPRCLSARVLPGGALYSASILRGRVELLGSGADQRRGGSTGARLRLVRPNYWEGPLTWLPLSNSGAQRVTGGLAVRNHLDSGAGHDNFATVDPADVLGDLPAPALLDLTGLNAGNTGTVYAAQAAGSTAAVYVFEGEHGAPGPGVTAAAVSDSAASEGRYLNLTWSGTNTVTAWQMALSAAASGAFGGRAFLPVLRLRHPNTESGLWFQWRVSVDYAGLKQPAHESPGRWLPLGLHHCAGAAFFLPPWPLGIDDAPPGLNLELRIQADGSGAHALSLDALHLLPLDAWRIYRPVIGSYSGLRLTDDPYAGSLHAGDWAIQMHQPEGPGLMVCPGEVSRYSFLFEAAGGGFTIETAVQVKIGYRPRRRGL